MNIPVLNRIGLKPMDVLPEKLSSGIANAKRGHENHA